MRAGHGGQSAPQSAPMRAKLPVVACAGVLAGVGAAWLAAHQPAGRPTEPGAGARAAGGCFAAGLRTRLVVESAREPAGPDHGRHRVCLVRRGARECLATVAEHDRISDPVSVDHRLDVPAPRLPFGAVDGPTRSLACRGWAAAGFGLQVVAMLYGNKAGLRCSGCANNVIQVFHDNQKALNWLGLQRSGRDRADRYGDRAAGGAMAAGRKRPAASGRAGAGGRLRHAHGARRGRSSWTCSATRWARFPRTCTTR